MLNTNGGLYTIMKSKLLTGLFATSLLLVGCSDTKEPNETTPVEETTPTEETSTSSIDKANFESIIVPRITGISFVETIDIQENEVTIKYFEDFDTYKAANPESNVDEEAYKLYWGSGDAIEKALFKGVSDLMDKEPNINKLNLSLPFDGKDYSYSVERSEVEKYIGADEYNDALRQEFIIRFIGEEITVDNVQ